MKKFIVRIPFQGYCRGTSVCEIKANTKEEAINKFQRECGEEDITRDDRDFFYEDAEAEEIN